MKLKIIGNTFKETGRNIIRHPFITIASLTTMTLMLLVLGFFIAFSMNANSMMDRISQTPPVEIWLRKNVNKTEIDNIDKALSSSQYVLEYKLKSPQDHYEQFKERLGEDAELLNSLDPKILPYSFTLNLKSPDMIDDFQKEIEVYPGIDEVQYSETVREFITNATKAVNWFSLIVVTVLFAIALLVISNMTRMSILARAEEISIMKYVGATNTYIRVPYLLEGAIIGLIGGLIGGGAIGFAYTQVYKIAMVNTPLTSPVALLQVHEVIPNVILILVGIGVVVGAIGSGLSVRKYVNV